MTALTGLFVTFLILESSAFGPLEFEARPLIWILLAGGIPLLATGIVLVLARRDLPRWQLRRRLRGFYLLAYGVTYGVILHPAGWSAFVLLDLGWLGQPLVSHALLVIPGVVLALWLTPWYYCTEHQFLTRGEREGRRFLPWLTNTLRLISVPGGAFAVAVVVAQLISGIPELEAFLEIFPGMAALVGLVALACVFVIFPRLVLLAWPTEPLPAGGLRASLEEMAARVGVGLRDVLIWDGRTDSLINACIVGHLAGGRRVLFTRGARRHLTGEELRAVFAHEISHITAGHLWCYAALLVAYVLSLVPLQRSLDTAPSWVVALVLLGITGTVWWLLFGCLSRRLETEADLRGAALVAPGVYLSALHKVRCLLGSAASRRDGWRHFSLDRRYETLKDALVDREAGQALLASCRRWKRACYCLLIVATAAFVWSTGRDFDRPASALALDRCAYLLGRAEDLRSVLEARTTGPRPPPWIDRGIGRRSDGIEKEYAGILLEARTTLESLGDGGDPAGVEETSAVDAALEEHLVWWKERRTANPAAAAHLRQ